MIASRRRVLFLLGTAILSNSANAVAQASSASPHPKLLRVALYDHSAGAASSPALLKALLPEAKGFSCEIITPDQIRKNALNKFAVLIMPGGSGTDQAEHLDSGGRNAICNFVREGGGYIGICAGAYLASSHYSWSLGLINARVVDTQHWARGRGPVKLAMTSSGHLALREGKAEVEVYYAQGPLLAPDRKPAPDPYEELATYATEIAENGAPSGVMTGTTAIARGTYGKGRVVCFSPHPEKEGGPGHFIVAGVRWVAGGD